MLKELFALSVIIGALPNTIANGQTADAVPLMADLNWIVNQVNSNAIESGNAALLNAANTFTAVQSGISATALSNFPTAQQVQNSEFLTLTSTAGANTITGRVPLSMSAYARGQVFTFVPPGSNGAGGVTMNINAIGAAALTKNGLSTLDSGDLTGGKVHFMRYTTPVDGFGTGFQLLNPAVSAATPSVSYNAQTGQGYVIVSGDKGKLITRTNAGAIADSLDSAATLGAGWWAYYKNIGATSAVIGRSDNALFRFPGGLNSGATSLRLPFAGTSTGLYNVSAVLITSDGTNFDVAATNETHGKQVFLSSGIFVGPAGVTCAWISGSGGGGTGGTGGSTNQAGGGGGGSGAIARMTRIDIVPGTTYAVTVGAAGATSSFGSLVSLAGGANGSNGGGDTPAAGGLAGTGGVDGSPSSPGDGTSNIAGAGGSGGLGGRGGIASTAGTAAGANTGGGGGGGGGQVSSAGGAGGTGYMVVEW